MTNHQLCNTCKKNDRKPHFTQGTVQLILMVKKNTTICRDKYIYFEIMQYSQGVKEAVLNDYNIKWSLINYYCLKCGSVFC